MKTLIFPFVFIILLCGCSGYKEINDGYLVTSAAFVESSSGIEIVLNTMQPETEEGMILSGIGDTLNSAFKDLQNKQVKSLYFEHCGTVVLNGDVKTEFVFNVLKFCKNEIKIPIAARAIYCSNAVALFEADRTGYDVITLLKNTKTGKDNRLYKLWQNKEFKLPQIEVRDNIITFEGEK